METIKEMFTSPNKIRNIVILIILVLVVAGGIYFIFNKQALAPSKLEEATGATATTTTSTVINVSDQKPGNVATIDSVTFENPGWIAIYDSVDGGPSSILGAHWFDKGTHTETNITLFLDMIAGQTYYAVLRSDDGKMIPDTAGSREFNTATDLPLTDTLTGQWLMTPFEVTSTGSRG